MEAVRRIPVLLVGVALLLSPGVALAWNCPVQIKSAEDAIKRAEVLKLPPEGRALVELAKQTVAEAKKNHTEARTKAEHANAMWRAKSAQAQAEAAAALAVP